MRVDSGRVNADSQVVYRVTWFVPDRPVDGGTVYLRPPAEDAVDAAAPQALNDPSR